MKKNTLIILTGLCLLMMSMSAEALPYRVVIDQMQPLIDETAGSLFIGGSSEQKLAQTVTVGLDGNLNGIYLPIGCESGRLVIEIRDIYGDEPGDTVLLRRGVPARYIPHFGPVFRFFPLGSSLSFVAGDRLAIVLRNPTGSCIISRGITGSSYAGGEGFYDALPNIREWIPFSLTDTHHDLPFIIRMVLP